MYGSCIFQVFTLKSKYTYICSFFGVHVWKNYIFTSLSTLYTNGLVIYMQTDNCYIYIYYTYNLKF